MAEDRRRWWRSREETQTGHVVGRLRELGAQRVSRSETARECEWAAECSRADSMRLLVLAAVVVTMSTLRADLVRARFSSSQSPEVAQCPILEDRCQCSSDLQEFVCRAAGFTTVPTALPLTITKLWVSFLLLLFLLSTSAFLQQLDRTRYVIRTCHRWDARYAIFVLSCSCTRCRRKNALLAAHNLDQISASRSSDRAGY